jgi:DNA-binding LytR/AlgR family response regulator
MNILIIEDELPARAKLIQMLCETSDDINIVGETGSVAESVEWFRSNPLPDLAFVDIQLSDDQSFEIFRKIKVQCPVVFTTAYDKYVMESFAYNTIDYLLKPITATKLSQAMEKIKNLEKYFLQQQVSHFLSGDPDKQTRRIIGKKGTEFITLELHTIAYFYTEHKVVFVRDINSRTLLVDQTLTELEEMLSPHDFFRINRKFLASPKSIERFRSDHGKVLVILSPPMKEPIHVSKETAPEFRRWMGQHIDHR